MIQHKIKFLIIWHLHFWTKWYFFSTSRNKRCDT